jgi:protein PhnA
MTEFPPCPLCKCEFTYPSDNLLTCPECFHDWDTIEPPSVSDSERLIVLDANGNELQNGDSVIVVKELARQRCAQAHQGQYQSKEHPPHRRRP